MTAIAKIIERVAGAMYWDRVNPDKGPVSLDIMVTRWPDLPDEHQPRTHVWHCKRFWRDAAKAAIDAHQAALSEAGYAIMPREPTVEMTEAGEANHGWRCDGLTDMDDVYRAMLAAAPK